MSFLFSKIRKTLLLLFNKNVAMYSKISKIALADLKISKLLLSGSLKTCDYYCTIFRIVLRGVSLKVY